MKLIAFRYFIIKTTHTLFEEPNNISKDLFFKPFEERYEIQYYYSKYTTRIHDFNGNYFWGYLFKSKDISLIKLDSKDFDEEEINNWDKLFFIIEKKSQLIFVEQKSQIASQENIQRVINKMVNDYACNYGYEIKIKFITDHKAFWNIIDSARGIYRIAFKLNAPNLFGATKKANEIVKTLQKETNMTEATFDLRNKNSNLKINREDLDSYRDYADSGGGEWTLGVLENKHKKKYSSKKFVKTIDLECNSENKHLIEERLDNIIANLDGLIEDLKIQKGE